MLLRKLLAIGLMMLAFQQQVNAKCLQKNTIREANPDPYRCTNEYMEPGKKMPDPENCQCYYHCNFRQQPCYICCPDGQYYYPQTEECVLWSAYRQCRDEPPRFQCPSVGLFRNTENCRKYWDCNQPYRGPVEEACPQEHFWDDRSKLCRKDSEVLSGERGSCG